MAKMFTFSGDETAPFFGFLSAAVALVFSCMGAACGTVKSGVGVASMGVMRPELVMKSIVPWAIMGHFNSIRFQSEKTGAYESCGQYALDWLQSVRNSYVGYDVPGISDHSKLINHGDVQLPSGPKPFRFFHMWTKRPDFLSIVSSAWNLPCSGSPMFKLCQKLKATKLALRQWNTSTFGLVQSNVTAAKQRLHLAQQVLSGIPTSEPLINEE